MKQIFSLLFLVFANFSFCQWAELNSGTTNNLQALYFYDADTGWVVGAQGTILKTTDGGVSWNQEPSGTSNNLTSVQFITDQLGYTAGQNGTILKTIDGGNSWTDISFGTKHIYEIHFLNADTGFVCGQNGAIYKTINGGATWLNISTSLNSFFSLHFFDAQNGLIAGVGDFRTNNGGNSYSSFFPYQTSFIEDICFGNPTNGLLTDSRLGNSCIYKTTDFGLNWDTSFVIPSFIIFDLSYATITSCYGVGNDYNVSVIIKTSDDGLSWTTQSPNTSALLVGIYFPDTLTGYAVGSNGTIIKTVNGGVGLMEISNSNKIKIYPNPITDEQIQLEGISSESIIEVFDNLGKMIVHLKNKNYIDLNEYSKGIYILRITQPEGLINYKIIKQ
jgi:photosystem II stability/assembly factor-like uncharacterized protein